MKIRHFYRIPPEEWLLTTNADVTAAQRKAIENPQMDERDIEEYVRQWVLRELIETYGYPREWLGERIIVEETVQMATMEKEADVSIKNERGKTYLFIETKNSGISDTEFAKAERQLEGYLSATHTATIGMVTDGTPARTRVKLKKIDPNDFDYIPDIPSYESGELRQKVKLVREIPDDPTKGKRTGLKPIDERYTDILFRCHSAIRSIDNLHDDESLDELCKVIYAKIYDERMTIQKEVGTAFVFQTYGGNTEEIASNIRDLYDEARRSDLETYTQRIPNYERSRGVFKDQIRLSSAALLRVVELLQEYSFIDSTTDIKGQAFQQVIGTAIRSGMGQYFTPDPVVRMVVEMIDPKPHEMILDPFCGSGHFLTVSLEYVEKNYKGKIDDYVYRQFAFFHLHGIEKDPKMVRIAMTDMMLHDDGHSNIRCTDALLSFDNYPDIKALAGEDNTSPEVFHVAMTNPPFGALLTGEVMQILGRFELGKGRDSLPLEILGLERTLQFLRPGGRMAIVLPQSILTNTWMKFVRDFILDTCRVDAIVSLPPQTFAPFKGVGKASVLFLTKKTDKNPSLDYPVFISVAKHVGYDNTGRTDPRNDLPLIAEDYKKYQHCQTNLSRLSFVINASQLTAGFAPELFVGSSGAKGWRTITLDELCDGVIFSGTTPPRNAYTDSGVRIIKFRNITNRGIDWSLNERAFVTEEFYQKNIAKKVQIGDIVVGTAAHHPKYIGAEVDIVDYIPEEYQGKVMCVAEIMVIRVNPYKIDPYYVLMYLRTEDGYRAFQRCIRGQTAHIYPKDVKQIQIPIPPDEEKEALNAIIEALKDGLKKRREFEETYTKATSAFLEYIGIEPSEVEQNTATSD